MLVDVLLLLLGIVMLYFGAEWLVRGAAGLARAFGVSPLVVGLTVVSYGTSAPELAVSTVAALDGKPDIALGNVVGSNIANLGLILGVTALIAPPRVEGRLIRRELPVLLLTALTVPLVLFGGRITRPEGAVLALSAVVFTYLTFGWARAGTDEEADAVRDPAAAPTGRGKMLVLALLGLGVLLVGGKVFVQGAVGLALTMGMSERTVGLTIVAVGTSLPELAASVVAATRGHSALAVGNVVGSNIFNVLLILGATSVITPISGSLSANAFDLSVMIGLTVVAIFMMRGRRVISRLEGGLLTAIYVGFLVALALQ
ncbi:MAG: calcium/sodium antiporter [Polyangiaceae bacterium]